MGQEFTMQMFTTVHPIGLVCGSLITAFYLYSLIKSFEFKCSLNKQWSARSPEEKKVVLFQSATLAVCILWIVYVIINLFAKWFMLSACHIRPAATQTAWVISRAAVYYFFVARCKIAFEGTPFAFSKLYIWMLIGLITLFYGFSAGFYIGRSHLMMWIEAYQICMPSYVFVDTTLDTPLAKWHQLGNALIYIQLASEAVLGLLLVGGYVYKLVQLQRSINALGDQDINGNMDEMTSFLKLAKKQAKMAWVAYVSSILLLYIAGLYLMLAFAPWLDGIINLTCVFCTFTYAHNLWIYRNVCECKGNRLVLFVCCFLCIPCNVPKARPEVCLELEVKRTQNDLDTTNGKGISDDITNTSVPVSSGSEDMVEVDP
eukprot:432016_1